KGRKGDPYSRHVQAVQRGALERLDAMLAHATKVPAGMRDAIEAAAVFHDLGKLDPDNQACLRRGRGHPLKWDHIDAGVAYLASQNEMAAWLVRAHHAPWLPQKSEHFDADGLGRKLRGLRDDRRPREEHKQQITR